MSRVGDCPRCGAPQGLIGWLCGHNGDDEHDRQEDAFWEGWNRRMNRNSKDQKGTEKR